MRMKFTVVFLFLTLTHDSSVFAGTGFCIFEHTNRYFSDLITDHITGYVCTLDFDFKDDRVDEIRGYHERGESDNQVDIIKVDRNHYSFLTSFPGTFCSKFRKLEIIDMSGAEITKIEANSLNQCKNLTILQFYLNKIDTIPEKLLSTNTKLLQLYIAFNQIKTLPENLLNGLTELFILDLSYNQIDNLPDNVFKDLQSLKDLNLEGNLIKTLGDNLFAKLEKLEKLNLNSNQIEDLPTAVFKDLRNLKHLYIQQNKLTIIHADSFPENIKIEVAAFSKNQIHAIDEYFIGNCDVGTIKMAGNVCDKTSTIKKNDIMKKLAKCFDNYRLQAEAENSKNNNDDPVTEPTTTTKKPKPTTSRTTTRTTTRLTTTTTRPRTTTTTRSTTTRPRTITVATTTTSRKTSKSQVLQPLDEPCGTSKAPVQNIIGGTEVVKGTYPWIAALIDNNGSYFCGGTLVSNRMVITAAHCIFNRNSVEKTPGDFVVLLGAHELDNENEIGRKVHRVSDIRMERNWNPTTRKFDSDIAVLKMNEAVKFGTWIQPVCLPKISKILKNFNYGEVVGFGKFDKSGMHSNIPRKANTPIRKSDDCYNEFPQLSNIASHKTFCGGFANGTGVCNGDSGGGLYVVQDDVYYLRGIVSASLHGTDYGCDVKSYSIFTDIRFHLNFIKATKSN